MPIYEYKCDDCGVISDILVRNTANQSPLSCPTCKSANMSKQISAPAAVMTKGASADIPPIQCPNVGKCGVSPSSCPAANRPG